MDNNEQKESDDKKKKNENVSWADENFSAEQWLIIKISFPFLNHSSPALIANREKKTRRRKEKMEWNKLIG